MIDGLTTSEIPNLKEQLKTLELLQELDLKIDRVKKDKSALPATLKKKDAEILVLKKQVDTKLNAIAEVEKVQKQIKAASEMNDDRLKRSQARLEQVQNTQEYQAITKEVEQLKKFLAQLQEQNQKAQSDIDLVQKDLSGFQEKLTALTEERAKEAETIGSQDGKLNSEMTGLSDERTQFTSKIDRRILSIYDRVRTARAGLGFVPVIQGRCKGCNMVLPPQLHNDAQRGTKVHSCPSCHRLIYIPLAIGSESTG